MECCCCFTEESSVIKCPDNHVICKDCVTSGVKVAIGDVDFFKCPSTITSGASSSNSSTCNLIIEEHLISKVINHTLIKGYRKITTFKNLAGIPNLVSCNKCDYAIILDDNTIKYFNCVNCKQDYCIKCKRETHGDKPCYSDIYKEAEDLTKIFTVQCCVPLIKHDACNHLTCPKCHKRWCWYCKKEGWHDNVCPLYNNPPEAPEIVETNKKIEQKLKGLKNVEKDNASLFIKDRLAVSKQIKSLFNSIEKLEMFLTKMQNDDDEIIKEYTKKSNLLVELINMYNQILDFNIDTIIDLTISDLKHSITRKLNISSDYAPLQKIQSRISTLFLNYKDNKSTLIKNYDKIKSSVNNYVECCYIYKPTYINDKDYVNFINEKLFELSELNEKVNIITNKEEINTLILYVNNTINKCEENYAFRNSIIQDTIFSITNLINNGNNKLDHLNNISENNISSFISFQESIKIQLNDYINILDDEVINTRLHRMQNDLQQEIQVLIDSKALKKCFNAVKLNNLRSRRKILLIEYENGKNDQIIDTSKYKIVDKTISKFIHACSINDVNTMRNIKTNIYSTLDGFRIAVLNRNIDIINELLSRPNFSLPVNYIKQVVYHCIDYNYIECFIALIPKIITLDNRDIYKLFNRTNKSKTELIHNYIFDIYLCKKYQFEYDIT